MGAPEQRDELVLAVAAEWGREPWIPAGMWVPKVGDCVEIRLSGECDEKWGDSLVVEAHPSWADGRTGVVDWVGPGNPRLVCADDPASVRRHPYLIRLDEDGPGGTWGLSLAASELLPLDAAAQDDGPGLMEG